MAREMAPPTRSPARNYGSVKTYRNHAPVMKTVATVSDGGPVGSMPMLSPRPSSGLCGHKPFGRLHLRSFMNGASGGFRDSDQGTERN